ncbi:MAG: helix-hairpin-helix domain-containing protein [Candidatus Aminicenantes bacterium]|nr:helix-hairpin-helix domain-containing protein [Candidatus Aminicenantes bacterium]
MRYLKIFLIFFLVLAIFSMSGVQLQGAEKKTVKKSGQININTAGIDQLSKLPGIGKKKAERIISFRKKHGRFRRTREIMKVKGIGEKTFKKFANRIRV